ncbi:MAG: class I SAM-dependent methyltransferase [Cyanobacteria bacterium SBLK]|nr:class I SAM-dependent methyltransferase [Cyanobacteria bacterium SBLK]
MTNFRDPELLAKIRQQFDRCPYPKTPVETSHKNHPDFLYIHDLTTAYYLRDQKVIDTRGKKILDAGCGTGLNALGLAEANPGAKIVGIDLSPESIEFAKMRLQYHGFNHCEFYTLSIEELEQLDTKFDYINCDEVLYLLSEPLVGLQAMKSVLEPEGIIRFNLHSLYGRDYMLRGQELFRKMGLMEESPGDFEVNAVRETMQALKDNIILKQCTWQKLDKTTENIFTNFLLLGDKGFTAEEVFGLLEQANLEFIEMVQWKTWDLLDLFKDPDNLPVLWGLSLPELSVEERLALYDLLHPIHRLLDMWCGHPGQGKNFVPVSEWQVQDWQNAIVDLHPQLRTQALKEELQHCLEQLHPFEISRFLPESGDSIVLDSTLSACLLLPLLTGSQSIARLVQRWQNLHPVHPITLSEIAPEEAWKTVSQAIASLVESGYLLVERVE